MAVLVFVYNLKSGFRAVQLTEELEAGVETLELPPEHGKGERGIFNCDPKKTLAYFQRELEEEGGRIDLRRKVDYTAQEFEVR